MSGLTLLNPLGLLALGSLAGVAIIYLFYKRHRKRVVTGLFLWEAPVAFSESGRRLARPRSSRSLLLDLLACLALSLAVAGPAITASYGSTLVIILDGSLSMRAGENYRRAREQAEALVEDSGAGRDIVIIEAGRVPRVLVDAGATRAAYRQAFAAYDPFSPKQSLAAALALARERLSGRITVHLFTDEEPKLKSVSAADVTVHTLRGNLDNLALVDALRKRDPLTGGEHLILAAAGFIKAPVTARLILKTDRGLLAEEPLRLGPGEIFRGTYALPEETGPVTATLSAAPERDALGADSQALLLPPPTAQVSYAIDPGVRGGVPFLKRALDAAGAVRDETGAPHLLVTSDGKAWGGVMTLTLAASDHRSAGFVGPFVVDGAHPLLRDVDLVGVFWVPATQIVTADRASGLITVGDQQLYYQTAPDRLHLNADLDVGNLSRSPAWPVMMAGVVDRTRDRLPGLRRANYLSGEGLRFVPAAAADLNPDRLKGVDVDLRFPTLKPPPRLPERPGRYELLREGRPLSSIAVNAIAPEESDLRSAAPRSAVTQMRRPGLEAGGARRSAFSWVLILIALLAAGLNWFLTRRGR